MGKSGGQGKGKVKRRDKGFGNALIRKQTNGSQGERDRDGPNMISMLESSALDDFVHTAVLHEDEVEVHRVHKNDSFLIQPTVHVNLQTLNMANFDYEHLRIPRKPAWSRDMTAAEVERNERNAFLEWRREIATMEQANPELRVTPFEKNIEVWRQLWRVLERSDFAVQIVDARNPVLYFSRDLMKYASEQSPSKPMILLINKADFLTEYQRRVWAQHLDKAGIRFVFYSAANEMQRLDDAVRAINRSARMTTDSDNEDMICKPYGPDASVDTITELVGDLVDFWKVDVMPNIDSLSLNGIRNEQKEPLGGTDDQQIEQRLKGENGTREVMNESVFVFGDREIKSSAEVKSFPSEGRTPGLEGLEYEERLRRVSRVLTRNDLELLLNLLPRQLGLQPQERHKDRICVGMLGFPNVGKSSVINTLMSASRAVHGVTRVGVSSTPGKTKHFQTLMVSDELMLCDCPGLVFPSFMSSTGQMLCSGILPINQMRDYISPAEVISTRVPQHLLDATYGMRIKRDLDVKDNVNRPPNATELLSAYCAVRGLITSSTGRWDEFRACKEMLRDFNDGKILYVAPPMAKGEVQVDEKRWLQESERTMLRSEKVAERVALQKLRAADAEASIAGGIENDVAEGVIPSIQPKGGNGMVFGGGEFEFVDDEQELLGAEEEEENEASSKREHKRNKTWGKKNKKLRNKNPYGDEGGVVSYAAFSTTRNLGGPEKMKAKVKRHNPNQAYGSAYTRTTLPHYMNSTAGDNNDDRPRR